MCIELLRPGPAHPTHLRDIYIVAKRWARTPHTPDTARSTPGIITSLSAIDSLRAAAASLAPSLASDYI